MQDRWGWLPDHTIDWQWQNALVDYLISRGICDSCYWSINPESGDTGGLFLHAYDPYNNTGGWGTWEGQDSRKLQLLNRYWNDCSTVGTATPGTSTATPTPGTGTATPTPGTGTATPTPVGGTCNVSFDPANSTQGVNSTFQIGVDVNSGSQEVAAYGFTITYDSTILNVMDVEAGADGFLAAANPNNPGEIIASGFDASGTGPGSSLEILLITFEAVGQGLCNLGISVDQLVDPDTNTIGAACGNSGSVDITNVSIGDTNGDGEIDIIDALLTAQYYVGLNPANFNPGAADANCDGNVDIIDALLIAQYYVGLITVFC
jgi:hypothetical protein